MTLLEPSPYRDTPVRLADVPKDERLAAAREAMRDETEPENRLRIMLLAEHPGDTVCWIHQPKAA